MDLKTMPYEKLLENLEIYQDRIETVNDRLESEGDSFIRDTLLMKLDEYRSALKTLNIELQRRQKEIDIVDNLQSQQDAKSDTEESFPDETISFKTKHFQRIESNKIDQDYDYNMEMKITFSNNRNKSNIVLPVGNKSGKLNQRSGSTFYYQGDEPDYDFQIIFEKEKIIKVIIHQSKSGADFIYI